MCDSQLIVGQSLVIPDKVANAQNNAATSAVYNSSQALGNTAPTHPPAHNSNGCGLFGEIVEAVVSSNPVIADPV